LRRLLILAAALALAGCGGDGATTAEREAVSTSTVAPDAEPAEPEVALRAPPCPDDAVNCERASGRIVYVERVDPDGDDDAHFVLISDEGITAPGISVIDVAAALRPDPLPRPGDVLAAAGPVYEGSYGQRQIEATAVRYERR
jgi:hypothetical protein